MSVESAQAILRIRRDDPEYLRQAEAEMKFWHEKHAWGLEAVEQVQAEGPVDFYFNERFTGDKNVPWYETVARRGTFRRGAMLGTSSMIREARILETNPALHMTFFDISEGPLQRRLDLLGKRFPGRVQIQVADLNFVEFQPDQFDLIASSSTIHHVTNLEFLAYQINRGLTPDGVFLLEDYVGERRFQFDDEKKRIYEQVFNRDLARQGNRQPGLIWLDTSDLSPFCGVRSADILDVFRSYLQEVEVRTAGALTVALTRSRPAIDETHSPWITDDWVLRQPKWRFLLGVLRHKLPWLLGRHESAQSLLDPRFLEELFTVGDVLVDANVLKPGVAFATYRKRR